MPEVRLVNVTKRYGSITALDNVCLDVRDKEYVSIIGPSGCGKTTLIKCIAGIVQPDEGEIYIDDRPANDLPVQGRNVGYVFQEVALFPHMNVRENVSYGPRVKGWDAKRTGSLVSEMLDMVKLSDRARTFPNELSGGAQQMTAVVRALASGSYLLLLDEPFGALDAKVRAELRYELRRMVSDLGLTAIHVTHDQEEAMSIADRLVVMKAGRVVEEGEPSQLYIRPKQIFTANFVGEANFMEGVVRAARKERLTVEVDGLRLETRAQQVEEGVRVVLAIRPEFVSISPGPVNSENSWSGTIENVIFMGSTIRYEVRAANGLLLAVKYPLTYGEPELQKGDVVSLGMSVEQILVYAYPEAGLEKAKDLE